jgi:hypothetical protein
MSMLYKDKAFTEGKIQYNDRNIDIYIPSTDALTIPQFYAFLSVLSNYLDVIDTRLESLE